MIDWFFGSQKVTYHSYYSHCVSYSEVLYGSIVLYLFLRLAILEMAYKPSPERLCRRLCGHLLPFPIHLGPAFSKRLISKK
jgi:hypothetical protein